MLQLLHLERYKHLQQQLQFVNENVHKYLTLFQTLATAIIGAMLALFVGYKGWDISPTVARSGIQALAALFTVVACFTILMILAGLGSWFDYRLEECELLTNAGYKNFRKKPSLRNFFRWYETYVLAFILATIGFVLGAATMFLLPNMT